MPGTHCAAINVHICRNVVPGRAGGYTPGRSAAYENQALQNGGGRNRIGRREKWPKQSWEEGEIGGKSREEGGKKS